MKTNQTLRCSRSHPRRVCVSALAAATLVVCQSAEAQIVETVKVAGTTSNFVVGGGVSGYSNTLIWSDTGSPVGGSSEFALTNVRAIIANPASTDRITTFDLYGTANADANASMTLDLGSDILLSDVSGYVVSQTAVRMIDYGAAASAQYYDFSIGLWDGSSPILAADELADLNLTIGPGSGSVSYQGSNIFRFTDGSITTGSDLLITSALAGYSVRTFAVGVGGFEEDTGLDRVAFSANRTLTPVPEPTTTVLALIAGMTVLGRRRAARR